MLTNNWYNIFKVYYGTKDGATVSDIKQIDKSGVSQDIYHYSSDDNNILIYANSTANADNYSGIFFGDGTTAPSKSDYNLSGNRVTGYSVDQIVNTYSVEGDTLTSSLKITLTNTSDSAITISEIAWFVLSRYANKSSCYVMLDRTLLETPVTIPAGQTGIVVYKRSVSFPTA